MTRVLLAAAALLALAAGPAQAAGAKALIGQAALDLEGKPVGAVEDLIVDVRAQRVIYVIIEADKRYVTLPVRAIEETDEGAALRFDMDLAGAVAKPRKDSRLRRAARLIGKHVDQPGGGRLGTLADLEFDPGTGRLERVMITDGGRTSGFSPSVLGLDRFPAETRWDPSAPSPEVARPGITPSHERNTVHEHRWKK